MRDIRSIADGNIRELSYLIFYAIGLVLADQYLLSIIDLKAIKK